MKELKFSHYLVGQGDLVSRFIAPLFHIVALLIPNINLFTKSL